MAREGGPPPTPCPLWAPLSPRGQRARAGPASCWKAQLVIVEVRGFWVPKHPGSLYSETNTPLFLFPSLEELFPL